MTTIARTEAAQIAALCTECGVPEMAAKLLAEGVSLDEAKTRVSAIGVATNMVATAGRLKPEVAFGSAVAMLAEGMTVADIRSDIFAKMVAAEDATSISSHPPQPVGNAGHAASRVSMENEMRALGMQPKEGTGR